MTIRRPILLLGFVLAIFALALALASARNPNLWSSPDQRGDRLLREGKSTEAAKSYSDPYRQGIALYRAGDFKDASASFARVATPEAAFDGGNAFLMQGKYAEAIASYDRALTLRPGWKQAEENRAIAIVRRDRIHGQGGDPSGGQVKADKIVFEKGKNSQPVEKTEMAGDQPLSDEELRGLWLRRVQTKPADFLRAKFAFQSQSNQGKVP